MSNIVAFEVLSERYGWTPDQIRNQKDEDLKNYFRIIQARNRIDKYNEKKYGN